MDILKAWSNNLALKYFSGCEKILDVGCGEGGFIELDPKRIIGMDHNRVSLSKCKAKGLAAYFGEATDIPFKDNSFDGVHCSHLIEHLQPVDAHKLLSEMDRVLKAEGVLFLETPLLHQTFYHDFTHIKPYYPEAVLHYLGEADTPQTTLGKIKGKYKVLKLEYRRQPLFSFFSNTSLGFLMISSNLLYRFGITGATKTGYALILKKAG